MTARPVDATLYTENPLMIVPRNKKYLYMSILYLLFASDLWARVGINALLPLIQTDLQLSDTQVGMIGSCVLLGMTTFVLPMSYLADKWSKRGAVCLMAMTWSIGSLFCGLASGFGLLLAGRFMVGIGNSSYAPASVSMLTDWFIKRRWGRVIGLYNTGFQIGISGGLIVTGFIAAQFGWKAAFIVIGLPGLVLGLLALCIPNRKKTAAELAAPKVSAKAALKVVFKNRTLMLVALASGFFNLAAMSQITWTPSFFMREMGMDITQAASLLGIMGLLGGFVAAPIGGTLQDMWNKHDMRSRGWFPALALLTSAGFLIGGFSGHSILLIGIGVFAANMVPTAYHVITQEIVPAQYKTSSYGAADKILMPGLVDAHTHVSILATEYAQQFIAQVPWSRPEGGFFPTYGTKAEVLARLKELDATLPAGEPLWGVHYDDNQAGGYLSRQELDTVSTTRPILVSNMVFHRFWVNSALLDKAGIKAGAIPAGVQTDANGEPNGTLLEAPGLYAVVGCVPQLFNVTAKMIRHILPLFTNQGTTTVTDLVFGSQNPSLENEVALFQEVFGSGEQGVRAIAMPFYHTLLRRYGSFEAFIEHIQGIHLPVDSHFQLGSVKLYADGSIISHTSPLDWPGYWDGTPNRPMTNPPEEVRHALIELHKRGISTITHTNSNLACQIVLDAVEEAQRQCYRPDIRHRMEHCYGITAAQLRRARTLGVCIQFFTTQIYYYGDDHLAVQGPDRAYHLTPTGTAQRLGVSWGVHNDPPGTPQLPWMAIWATVNRQTLHGNILGKTQRVSVAETLHAVTLEHAYQLHLEDSIGSIEFGKKADFCVLEADPLCIDPMELRDMPVWGTVFEGVPFRYV